MRIRRALSHLLIIASLTLLQCLQPLLHAHPRDGAPEPGAQVAGIHLPDIVQQWASSPGERAQPVTITAQDDIRRLMADLLAPPPANPPLRLPGGGDAHVRCARPESPHVSGPPFPPGAPPSGPPASA